MRIFYILLIPILWGLMLASIFLPFYLIYRLIKRAVRKGHLEALEEDRKKRAEDDNCEN